MLRYPYFCRMHKGLFSCFVESGAFSLGVCPQTMHTTTAMHTEYETLEETVLCGTQKTHSSKEEDSGVMAKLHIPVMVDEVVHCLTPQKGQNLKATKTITKLPLLKMQITADGAVSNLIDTTAT